MSRRYLCLIIPLAAMQPACDSGNKPRAVPVAPVTVHKSPASAPSAEEVAVLKDAIGGSRPTPTTAPSASRTPPRTPDKPAPGMSIPPPGAPAQELKYDVPADWVSVKPDTPIRKAQWSLPRAEGDAEDGVVIKFYFGGGQGGGVTGNINRWKNMFSTEDGKPLPADAVKQESFEANGLNVTLVDLSGRYTESSMGPNAPPATPKSNHRMMAAMIETPDGSWFFRCTGPAATMAKYESGIRGFLKSVRQ